MCSVTNVFWKESERIFTMKRYGRRGRVQANVDEEKNTPDDDDERIEAERLKTEREKRILQEAGFNYDDVADEEREGILKALKESSSTSAELETELFEKETDQLSSSPKGAKAQLSNNDDVDSKTEENQSTSKIHKASRGKAAMRKRLDSPIMKNHEYKPTAELDESDICEKSNMISSSGKTDCDMIKVEKSKEEIIVVDQKKDKVIHVDEDVERKEEDVWKVDAKHMKKKTKRNLTTRRKNLNEKESSSSMIDKKDDQQTISTILSKSSITDIKREKLHDIPDEISPDITNIPDSASEKRLQGDCGCDLVTQDGDLMDEGMNDEQQIPSKSTTESIVSENKDDDDCRTDKRESNDVKKQVRKADRSKAAMKKRLNSPIVKKYDYKPPAEFDGNDIKVSSEKEVVEMKKDGQCEVKLLKEAEDEKISKYENRHDVSREKSKNNSKTNRKIISDEGEESKGQEHQSLTKEGKNKQISLIEQMPKNTETSKSASNTSLFLEDETHGDVADDLETQAPEDIMDDNDEAAERTGIEAVLMSAPDLLTQDPAPVLASDTDHSEIESDKEEDGSIPESQMFMDTQPEGTADAIDGTIGELAASEKADTISPKEKDVGESDTNILKSGIGCADCQDFGGESSKPRRHFTVARWPPWYPPKELDDPWKYLPVIKLMMTIQNNREKRLLQSQSSCYPPEKSEPWAVIKPGPHVEGRLEYKKPNKSAALSSRSFTEEKDDAYAFENEDIPKEKKNLRGMRNLGLNRTAKFKESLIIEDDSSSDDLPSIRQRLKRSTTTSQFPTQPNKRVLSGDFDNDFDPDWIGDEYLGKSKQTSDPPMELMQKGLKKKTPGKSSTFVQLSDAETSSEELKQADDTVVGQTQADINDSTFPISPLMRQALDKDDSSNDKFELDFNDEDVTESGKPKSGIEKVTEDTAATSSVNKEYGNVFENVMKKKFECEDDTIERQKEKKQEKEKEKSNLRNSNGRGRGRGRSTQKRKLDDTSGKGKVDTWLSAKKATKTRKVYGRLLEQNALKKTSTKEFFCWSSGTDDSVDKPPDIIPIENLPGYKRDNKIFDTASVLKAVTASTEEDNDDESAVVQNESSVSQTIDRRADKTGVCPSPAKKSQENECEDTKAKGVTSLEIRGSQGGSSQASTTSLINMNGDMYCTQFPHRSRATSREKNNATQGKSRSRGKTLGKKKVTGAGAEVDFEDQEVEDLDGDLPETNQVDSEHGRSRKRNLFSESQSIDPLTDDSDTQKKKRLKGGKDQPRKEVLRKAEAAQRLKTKKNPLSLKSATVNGSVVLNDIEDVDGSLVIEDVEETQQQQEEDQELCPYCKKEFSLSALVNHAEECCRFVKADQEINRENQVSVDEAPQATTTRRALGVRRRAVTFQDDKEESSQIAVSEDQGRNVEENFGKNKSTGPEKRSKGKGRKSKNVDQGISEQSGEDKHRTLNNESDEETAGEISTIRKFASIFDTSARHKKMENEEKKKAFSKGDSQLRRAGRRKKKNVLDSDSQDNMLVDIVAPDKEDDHIDQVNLKEGNDRETEGSSDVTQGTCPICNEHFPQEEIEDHASACGLEDPPGEAAGLDRAAGRQTRRAAAVPQT